MAVGYTARLVAPPTLVPFVCVPPTTVVVAVVAAAAGVIYLQKEKYTVRNQAISHSLSLFCLYLTLIDLFFICQKILGCEHRSQIRLTFLWLSVCNHSNRVDYIALNCELLNGHVATLCLPIVIGLPWHRNGAQQQAPNS